MADEAYRAVFLRVHPTGKMVLSLTTERRRQRGRLRAARRRRARRARAGREGRARRREPLRLRARVQRGPSAGTPAAITTATGKILAKAKLLAGVDLGTDDVEWADGAFVGGAESRTIADLALYAHGTGALPPGVEGGLDAQTVYRD